MSRPEWDPGWWRAIRLLGPVFVKVQPSDQGRARMVDALTMSRILWLAFFAAPLLLCLLLALSTPWNRGPVRAFPLAIATTGVLVHAGAVPLTIRSTVRRMRSVQHDASDVALIGPFQAAMIAGIGFAAAVSMLGFIGSLVSRSLWLLPFALSFALPAMVRVGPFQRTFRGYDRLLLRKPAFFFGVTEAWRQATCQTLGSERASPCDRDPD
jgi:hypothetical protein